MTPVTKARQTIHALLVALGWCVWDAFSAMPIQTVAEVSRHFSFAYEFLAEIDTNRKCTFGFFNATLTKSFARVQ